MSPQTQPSITTETSSAPTAPDRERLLDRFQSCRGLSLELCSPLSPEDFRIQSMADVSPPWWNLGHTSWFFAKNILEPHGQYVCPDFSVPSHLDFALNSYYETHGDRIARHERGLLSRPTTAEILEFRAQVDELMVELIGSMSEEKAADLEPLVITGIHHEQQHQELLVTELKHIYFTHPRDLRPRYLPTRISSSNSSETQENARPTWLEQGGGLVEIGSSGDNWCWDNERPRHKVWLEPYEIFSQLITTEEYLEFITDGGYDDPLLWLANGWGFVQQNKLRAPLYWEEHDGEWRVFTLAGERSLSMAEPVCHLSFYEAEAFARWKSQVSARWRGARLPTEAEWEAAAVEFDFDRCAHWMAANLLRPGDRQRSHSDAQVSDTHERENSGFLSGSPLHPQPAATDSPSPLRQICGDLWEWTTSHYEPYPGYQPFDGDLMEYNGKFMDNQRVLRGGSCATPAEQHLRSSYRNFWPADTRFQFTGIRLVR